MAGVVQQYKAVVTGDWALCKRACQSTASW